MTDNQGQKWFLLAVVYRAISTYSFENPMGLKKRLSYMARLVEAWALASAQPY